jgi:hypothetical protein
MIPLTPGRLIAAATSFDGLREEGGNNRGLMIEKFLNDVGLEAGQPWCAAFVHHVGYWSHFDSETRQSSWSLPDTGSCYLLGHFALRNDILRDEPTEGDVFLVWKSTLGRFAHTGVVVRVRQAGKSLAGNPWFDCDTVEGNSNEAGSRDATSVVRIVRRFNPSAGDRFIRWAILGNRGGAVLTPTATRAA